MKVTNQITLTGIAAHVATLRPSERVTGIEPALSAWEADVLPLNYTREWWSGYPVPSGDRKFSQ